MTVTQRRPPEPRSADRPVVRTASRGASGGAPPQAHALARLVALRELAAGRPLPPVSNTALLTQGALAHRLGGVLLTRAEEGEVRLDAADLHRLRMADTAMRLWHRQLRHAASEVLGCLEAAGIEAAVFKGLAANAAWYDRDGERPCDDLDLLLAPHQLHRAAEVVRLIEPAHPLSGSVDRLVARGELQALKLTTAHGVDIDLHFDLLKVEVQTRQRSEIWSRVVDGSIGDGARARVIDSEVALMQLLLELNKDRFRYLVGYADVARLLRRHDIDWTFIEAFARAEGVLEPVALSMEVVTSTLGLPAAPLPRSRGWRAAAWRALWRPSTRLHGDRGYFRERNRQRVIPVLGRGRAIEGARAYVRYLFPPRELAEWYFGGTPGGYAGQVTIGRWRHVRERRQAVVDALVR